MTEAPISVQFDPKTLEEAGVPFKPPGVLTTAHPHLDRADGGMLNYAAKLGPRNEYRFFHLAPDSDEPEVIARIPVKRPGYVHSFGLTERYIVFAEFPWVVNPLDLALSGRPYAENLKWEPERGTRFFLIDRETGKASKPIVTDAFFAFHFLNAYEEDGEVVADISVYPDAGMVQELYLDNLRGGDALTLAELRRFRIDPTAGTIEHEQLVDGHFELGRINYGRCNERPYRYAWGTTAVTGRDWIDGLAKIDVQEGSQIKWSEPGAYPGEPIFVAEPGAEDEDAGVALSVVLDAGAGTSYLLVLDARDMTELARASVPHHIPFSFHGMYTSRS
jgi:carotenoid cleavage dioxygenase-like enzyme